MTTMSCPAGRRDGAAHLWRYRGGYHVGDDDARQGEVVPRQAGIISVEVGWTLAECWDWNKAQGFERKEANEVFKVVAQTDEAIFYICRWLEYVEEELCVKEIESGRGLSTA